MIVKQSTINPPIIDRGDERSVTQQPNAKAVTDIRKLMIGGRARAKVPKEDRKKWTIRTVCYMNIKKQ